LHAPTRRPTLVWTSFPPGTATRGGATLPAWRPRAILADPIVFGTMLVESGEAGGLVAGACATTGATIEPALRVRRLTPGLGPLTSCFLMEIPPGRLAAGRGDVLVFADCALNPDPSPMMLARIALAAARAARELCKMEPVIALLSSSSHGSASHERVLAVRQAVAEVRRRAPDLCVDGELQADAALVAAVGERKAPAARSRAARTCSSSPASSRGTSATSSSNGSPGRARSGLSSPASAGP
jgi:phosphotransacetylase